MTPFETGVLIGVTLGLACGALFVGMLWMSAVERDLDGDDPPTGPHARPRR